MISDIVKSSCRLANQAMPRCIINMVPIVFIIIIILHNTQKRCNITQYSEEMYGVTVHAWLVLVGVCTM